MHSTVDKCFALSSEAVIRFREHVWPDVRLTSNVIREASPKRTAADPRTTFHGLIHSLG